MQRDVLLDWKDIPEFMKCEEVREYYDILLRKKTQLYIIRLLDIVLSAILLILLAIPMIIIAVMIKMDSPGKVFFRQERVTSYGRVFRIHKFRTMADDRVGTGALVTSGNDARITRAGSKLRDLRLDELPQLIDVFVGDMTFVGTRAEVPKYVSRYSNEMNATLLLKAGVTSETSIRFKDEAKLLEGSDDVERTYVDRILPEKMKMNLKCLRKTGILYYFKVMIMTLSISR